MLSRRAAAALLLLIACGKSHEADDAARPDAERDAGPPPSPFARATSDPVADVAADGLGNVYALETTGTLWAWTQDGTERFRMLLVEPVAAEGRHALIALDEGVVISTRGMARSFSPDGLERWTTAVTGACAVARSTDGTVAVAGADEVAVLDERTGERVRGLAVPSTCPVGLVGALQLAGGPDGSYTTALPLRVHLPDGRVLGGLEGPALRELHGLAVAPDGTVALIGVYDRAGSLGSFPDLPAPRQFDPVVLIYNADATPRAAVPFMGVDFEYPYGVDADANGFRVAGHFGEFGNGIDIGPFHLDSTGTRNVFLAHVSLDGTVRDARAIPGDSVVPREIARHPTGRWVVGGILFPGPLRPPDTAPVEGGRGFVYLGWQ